MEVNLVKILVTVALGLGSMLFGLLPAALARYNLRRNPIVQTVLLCFGAGILLATSVVHMLPEVEADIPDIAQIVFCCGFLLVYLADELLHLFCGEAIQHQNHGNDDAEYQPILEQSIRSSSSTYGSTERCQSHNENDSCSTIQAHHEAADESTNARICHTNHQEPCRQTLAGIIGMLFALSIHSLLEGLAIGIQNSTSGVMILFTAVISHKLVVAFCLGVELSASHGSKFKHHFLAIFVFSAGSVVGILIGMGIVDMSSVKESKTLPILQGIAAGTLLYVTLCEVLPREKARWHQNRSKKTAGIVQFFAFSVGFAVMTLMNTYISDGD